MALVALSRPVKGQSKVANWSEGCGVRAVWAGYWVERRSTRSMMAAGRSDKGGGRGELRLLC